MSDKTPNYWFRAQQHRITLAGMTHNNADGSSRQALLKKLRKAGDVTFELLRDPNNEFDSDALAVLSSFGQVGFVPAEFAAVWSTEIDSGAARFTCGYAKISEWTPDDGRPILTMQFDVHEWRQDKKPRRSASVPPPHRRLDAQPAPRGGISISPQAWLLIAAVIAVTAFGFGKFVGLW